MSSTVMRPRNMASPARIAPRSRAIPEAIAGYPVDQISFLFLLCAAYLGLVIVNGAVKYVINVYSGIVGERMLRRFRYELYSRVLRFPLPHFKRTATFNGWQDSLLWSYALIPFSV